MAGFVVLRGALAGILLAGLTLAGPASAQPSRPPALEIQAGSVAHHQVVAIGRDLVIAGRALSDVAAISGSVTIRGEVGGDVIVLEGDARLDEAASIAGDLFVVGGRISAAPGARIGGGSGGHPGAAAGGDRQEARR